MERQMAKGTFTRVDNYLFEQGRYLTPEAKLVYVVLCSYRNNKTGKTFPSYEKIQERSGLGRNKIAAALRELEYFYWISRNKAFTSSNHYYLSNPVDTEYKQPAECPTKEAAMKYAKEVRANKKRYGKNPFEEEQDSKYVEEEEYLDDDQIPF